MRGPFWNAQTGVTGEENNYVTISDSTVNNGEPRTFTGAKADLLRAELPLSLS